MARSSTRFSGANGSSTGRSRQPERRAGRSSWWCHPTVRTRPRQQIMWSRVRTSRSESVRAGLAAIAPDASDDTVVVVHDAARPFATRALFEAVIAAVRSGADGAVPGLPITDTVKQVRGDRSVFATLDRAHLVTVQTPQAFRLPALRAAHQRRRRGHRRCRARRSRRRASRRRRGRGHQPQDHDPRGPRRVRMSVPRRSGVRRASVRRRSEPSAPRSEESSSRRRHRFAVTAMPTSSRMQ